MIIYYSSYSINKLKWCVGLLIGILLWSTTSCFSEDWSMFRHDLQHSGVSNDTSVLRFPLSLKWKCRLGAAIMGSSPAIVNNTAYVGVTFNMDDFMDTTNDNKIFSISCQDGTIQWDYNKANGIIESSPCVLLNNIYVGSNDGKVYAINETGTQAWSFLTGTESLFSMSVESSPCIQNKICYITSTDGYLYAINIDTGTLTWKCKLGDPVSILQGGSSYSSPAIVGETIYVGYGTTVHAVSSGSIVWTGTTSGRIVSSPVVVNNWIYIGSDDEYFYAFNINNPSENWKKKTNGKISSSPAVIITGTSGMIYVGSEDHSLYAFDIKGNKVWNFPTNDSIHYSSPLVHNDIVYIGSFDNKIYAINAITGDEIWSCKTGGAVDSSPALSNGTLYIGSWDGCLYAFHNATLTTTSITPALGPDKGTMTLTINGDGFLYGAGVRLVNGSQTIEAATATVVDAGTITAIVSLSEAAPCKWDVVVTNPDGKAATLTCGFVVRDTVDVGSAATTIIISSVAEVEIPVGAVMQDVQLLVNTMTDMNTTTKQAIGSATNLPIIQSTTREFSLLGWTGTTFNKPITISIPYPSGMVNPSKLRMFRLNKATNTWVLVNQDMPDRINRVDMARGMVIAEVDSFSVFGIGEYSPLPSELAVYTFPNPAEDTNTLTFRYFLPEQSDVTIDIYDMNYDLVESLGPGSLMPDGYSEKIWDISRVGSGVYIYVFKAGEKKVVKRLTIVR